MATAGGHRLRSCPMRTIQGGGAAIWPSHRSYWLSCDNSHRRLWPPPTPSSNPPPNPEGLAAWQCRGRPCGEAAPAAFAALRGRGHGCRRSRSRRSPLTENCYHRLALMFHLTVTTASRHRPFSALPRPAEPPLCSPLSHVRQSICLSVSACSLFFSPTSTLSQEIWAR